MGLVCSLFELMLAFADKGLFAPERFKKLECVLAILHMTSSQALFEVRKFQRMSTASARGRGLYGVLSLCLS